MTRFNLATNTETSIDIDPSVALSSGSSFGAAGPGAMWSKGSDEGVVVSDLSPANTHRLAPSDLPGGASSNPRGVGDRFIALGSRVFFTATDATGDRELYAAPLASFSP